MDALEQVAAAVQRLDDEHEALLAACTDPQATDMAELFAAVLDARKQLQTVERAVELATAKAMAGDYAETATLRVERYRATDRKAWEHDAWQRDVRAKVLRRNGLAGAQGVIDANGEVLPADALHAVLAELQGAHSAAGPRTTALRALGLDARDYCETSPGAWHVKVLRMADEQEGAA